MLFRAYLCALGASFLLGIGSCCDHSESICGAQAPGDILIGVLNPCHTKVETLQNRTRPGSFNCTSFDLLSFTRALAVIHTIDTINHSGFIPGVRLGYVICDTCSYATKALQNTEYLLSINGTLSPQCNHMDRLPVKAIIGERFSEVSITVARLLGLYMVPQISTTSSAPILSDKVRFPSFLRTIPSDTHQTRALARLMSHFSWEWVGVVYGDDDYGKEAMQKFLRHAEEEQVCVAYQEVLPHYLDHVDSERRIKEVARQIRSSKAEVVLLILKEQLVKKLFEDMLRANVSKIWIASDAWSMARPLASMEGINGVGDIFGFSFITGPNPGFEQFLQKLEPGPGATNHFIEEYKELRFGCTPELLQHKACIAAHSQDHCPLSESLQFKSELACSLPDPQKADDDFLINVVDLTLTYNDRVATWAIAHAIRELLKCNDTFCSGETTFPPWKLLQELKKINFTVDNHQFYFNEDGDFVNGYDLINWVKAGNERRFEVVGGYNLVEKEIKIRKTVINWGTPNNTVPESICSKPCPPGTVKKVSNISCCYNCTQCEEGTYSDAHNLDNCLPCPNGTWSRKGATQCQPRTEEFFRWGDPYAVFLLTAAGLGVLLLLVVLIIFAVGRNSPVVKVAGGNLCYVMQAGLAVSFGSIVLFMGKPNDHICRARQTMYGLGFTLCISCILVKAFRTFLAFLFDLNRQHKLKKLYKPPAIIVVTTALQGIICLFWLIFASPYMEKILVNQNMTILLRCNEGSNAGFGAMLAYISLVAFVCFVLALKGRKVPQRFNETGYIIFSVLIYLFVWVCFIPIYITKNEQSSAIQASAILVSNYGIIFCHFLPKCYMILCKKKVDISSKAYLDRVRIFSITSTHSAFADSSSVDSGAGSMVSVTTPGPLYPEESGTSTNSVATAWITEEPQAKDLSPHLRKRQRRCSI
ncbi:G-protein coupled receptor family C group 6 member A-like [Megalops cyprinoides]|uniref:G-protein coupled receptor family C group 6 member A-like n=1 Tax=Megalops cyprinoides TaxID=118141 RepID=UPI001863BFEA|nr:G-protein coupled receptor family C group 6 member A-like [Megalops cyprinoides]